MENSFSKLTEILSETLNKHAPIKSKTVRGNQAPFMNRVISKNIMNKSRIKNKYLKWPSRENYLAYKRIKNKCNNLLKISKKFIFKSTLGKVLPQVNNFGIQSNLS